MNGNDAPFINTASESRSRVREITPHQLTRTRPLPVIVDVREEEDFMRGHIAGAKHISRSVLEQKIAEIAPEPATPIVVYCAVGNQGPVAAEKLQRMGYRNISSLKGGLQNWLEAGGTVECPKGSSLAEIR